MAEWLPARLTPAQMAERRREAARLFRAGEVSQASIARRLGVTPAAVSQWRARWRHGGERRLQARTKSGRPARLTAAQWARLGRVVDRGALAAGFDTERWTLRRLADLIERQFGVRFHPRYLERPLKAHGFTPQHPATRATERDEYVIAQWPTREWVALKKRHVGSAARSWGGRDGSHLPSEERDDVGSPSRHTGPPAGEQAARGLEPRRHHARRPAGRAALRRRD